MEPRSCLPHWAAQRIVFGSVLALRQQRLKLLIAYSTIAQIGYLFLIFPLARIRIGAALEQRRVAGGCCKCWPMLSPKRPCLWRLGDLLLHLGTIASPSLPAPYARFPITVLAFVLAGWSLIGLPPGGGFVAKSLLLEATAAAGQWWWDWVMFAGSVLTSAYVVAVLMHALAPARASPVVRASVPRYQEATALVLALASLLLGIAAFGALDLIQIGRPDAADVGAVAISLSDVFSAPAVLKSLAPVLLGTALAIGLSRQEREQMAPARGAAYGGKHSHAHLALFDRTDDALRQWPVGSTSLLFLVIAFGAVMFAAH